MKEINKSKQQIAKELTGIKGLDEITMGGLPFARPTLIAGYAGSGKTVLAMQFILNGITLYNQPGVFISLEESEEDLRKNMSSFGYDLASMEKANKLALENIRINQSELYVSGHFNLSPLFIRIEEAVNKVGAKRIAIDTFELIFQDIQDINIFRQELVKLIRWLKERKLTAIFTSEKAGDSLQKSGIEEFITDCVITLKNIMLENIYTRNLHILKYRGSNHGPNEYPFLIDENGISLLPITSIEIHKISSEVISTGVKGLDSHIANKGFYVGSSTLISGTAGVGKTSFAISLCAEALKHKKKCIFFSFEESALQLKRNMKSIGFDLEVYEKNDLLRVISTRPSLHGLETHLVRIHKEIDSFDPEVVVFDPVTDLINIGTRIEVKSILLRLIDYLKGNLVTIVFTALVSTTLENEIAVSSLVDNWIRINTVEIGRERFQGLSLVKLRGIQHSRTEFLLSFDKNGLSVSEFTEPVIKKSQRIST